MSRYGVKQEKIEKVEATLVWRDGSKTQALVPVGADEVTCGKSRFRWDHRHLVPTYIEQT